MINGDDSVNSLVNTRSARALLLITFLFSREESSTL